MFDSQQKATGTQYTMTIALLLVAFVFSPAVLFVLTPIGYVSVSLAIACSVLCVGLAWGNWKNSKLTVPSIAAPRTSSK